MRTNKVPKGSIMTLTQQWRYLNLTRSSFYILFPTKGIMNFRQIISTLRSFKRNLFTRWPSTFKIRVSSLNNMNVNYLKILRKHHGPQKNALAGLGQRVCDPWSKNIRFVNVWARPRSVSCTVMLDWVLSAWRPRPSRHGLVVTGGSRRKHTYRVYKSRDHTKDSLWFCRRGRCAGTGSLCCRISLFWRK